MEKNYDGKDQMKIGFGKFLFEIKGDFVKENGKILAYGVVTCAVIAVSGGTYCMIRRSTMNGNATGNVVNLTPKVA